MISRYKKLGNIGNNWFTNSQLVKSSSLILALVLLYGLIIAFINSHFNLRNFHVYLVCLEGQKAGMNNVGFNGIMVLSPILLAVTSTVIMDVLSYLWLQRAVHPIDNENQGCVIIHEIPIRSTMISTLLLLPYLVIYFVISSQNIQPMEKYLVSIVGTRINDILRNPLVAIYTFKINEETRRKNADKERERKRQIEIQDAVNRRKERQQEQRQVENIQLEDLENEQPNPES